MGKYLPKIRADFIEKNILVPPNDNLIEVIKEDNFNHDIFKISCLLVSTKVFHKDISVLRTKQHLLNNPGSFRGLVFDTHINALCEKYGLSDIWCPIFKNVILNNKLVIPSENSQFKNNVLEKTSKLKKLFYKRILNKELTTLDWGYYVYRNKLGTYSELVDAVYDENYMDLDIDVNNLRNHYLRFLEAVAVLTVGLRW